MIGLVKADSKQLASSDSEKLGINCHELKLHKLNVQPHGIATKEYPSTKSL